MYYKFKLVERYIGIPLYQLQEKLYDIIFHTFILPKLHINVISFTHKENNFLYI